MMSELLTMETLWMPKREQLLPGIVKYNYSPLPLEEIFLPFLFRTSSSVCASFVGCGRSTHFLRLFFLMHRHSPFRTKPHPRKRLVARRKKLRKDNRQRRSKPGDYRRSKMRPKSSNAI